MKGLEKYVVSVIILFLAFACKNSENTSAEMGYEDVMPSEIQEQRASQIKRKLIKEGHVEFETDDLNSTKTQILGSVKKYKGYISSDQEHKSIGQRKNTIVIRVPAKDFDRLLNDATKGVQKFDYKTIEVKDVTEEFLDSSVRLKTKKELENRYLELLKKANNVTEVLEVEKQIGQLRAEIESIEGRLHYLKDQVTLSTLTLIFYKTVPNETEFGNAFKNGFKNGWENLIWFFVLLVNVWPFILIGIGLIFGVRLWRKIRLNK